MPFLPSVVGRPTGRIRRAWQRPAGRAIRRSCAPGGVAAPADGGVGTRPRRRGSIATGAGRAPPGGLRWRRTNRARASRLAAPGSIVAGRAPESDLVAVVIAVRGL